MSKFNIKTNKEPLSSEEISKKMDFDKFYSGYNAASAAGKASWLSKPAIYLSSTAIVLVTATFVIYKSVNSKKDAEQTAFINPPIPELNYRSEGFVIDNSKDTTIVYRSGTTIYVPANAFKHKDGKDAGKNVRISYREFRDPVDFIFSGIPMDYDSAGIKRPFESAGMFEVLGYENDSVPIYLKDGKTLNVNFLSDNDENKFNVYYLDTVAKRWDFEEHETRKHREDLDKLSKEKADFLARHGLDDPGKLITPKKADITLDNFIIDYNKEEFPELAVYEGVKFEVSLNEKNYTPAFKTTTWEDVFISRHPEGNNYILTFKQKNNKVSILASPVFDEKNYEAAMKEYEKIRLSHSKKLLAQADSINKLDRQFTSEEANINNMNERFAAFTMNGSIYRGIIVSRFGIHNFDRPVDMNAVYARLTKTEGLPSASFVCDGKKVLMRAVYLIKRDINAIYPLTPNEINQFPLALASNADIIIAITGDNKIMYAKDETYKSTDFKAKEIIFNVKKLGSSNVTNAVPNIDKIKAEIDI
jgi:hypothetical protein